MILDSRPVHSAVARNPAMIDAQKETQSSGSRGHDRGAADGAFYRQRRYGAESRIISRLVTDAAKVASVSHAMAVSTYPGYRPAPELVDTLWEDLRAVLPGVGAAPSIPQQSSLF